MEDAWLDSLSEDWVSQPRSVPGSVSNGSRPGSQRSTSAQSQSSIVGSVSRIPVLASKRNNARGESNPLPLGERSNNVASPRIPRPPNSKIAEGATDAVRGRGLSQTSDRSRSVSSSQSVQHNTVFQKSASLSPKKPKNPEDEPEWRRRLLNGEGVAYGEQKDLFSAAGLESLFMPPPASARPSTAPSPERQFFSESVMMPSSPPVYLNSQRHESNPAGRRNSSKPAQYRLAELGSDNFTENDLSQSSVFRPRATNSTVASGKTTDPAQEEQKTPSSIRRPREFNRSSLSILTRPLGVPQRILSGMSDIHNEDLSPIVLTRQSTMGGKVEFSPVKDKDRDLLASELHQKLENLNMDDEEGMDSLDSDMQSLPKMDTTTETDLAHNGHFVSVKRGGHEDSSFLQRPLSPSSRQSPVEESDMNYDQSVQDVPKMVPKIKKTRASNEYEKHNASETISSPPATPRSSSLRREEPERPTSKSSPLKLFGNYDTFTNQKLLRRLSQFESQSPEDEDENLSPIDEQSSREQSRPQSSGNEEAATRSEINAAYIAQTSFPEESQTPDGSPKKGHTRAFSSFGEGELDEFEFREEVELPSWESSEAEDEEANDDSNGSVIRNGGDQEPTQNSIFDFDESIVLEETFTRGIKMLSRRSSSRKRAPSRLRKTSMSSAKHRIMADPPVLLTPKKVSGIVDAHGKRLPMARSPSNLKDPTPKRRRTLHASDVDHLNESKIGHGSLLDCHRRSPTANDTHHHRVFSSSEDESRPNSGVSSQGLNFARAFRPQQPDFESSELKHKAPSRPRSPQMSPAARLQQEKIAQIQAELDEFDGPVPHQIKKMMSDSRKGSVTTQDFFNEAKHIMAAIREKARPSGLSGLSGLSSMEASQSDLQSTPNQGGGTTTSENDNDNAIMDDSFESSEEPFDRPPSRVNGGQVPRMAKEQSDPDLLEHLKQYEERSDHEAMHSMRTDVSHPYTEDEDSVHHNLNPYQPHNGWKLNDSEPYESDPPNIRITENPNMGRKRADSASSAPGALQATRTLSGSNSNRLSYSTGNSFPSRTSQGSNSRRVIAPDQVSHLIPQQLAGMVYDDNRMCWVKRKSVYGSQHSLMSEDDDPFGDIPDLTVDETQEMQRLAKEAAADQEEEKLKSVQEYQRSEFHFSQGTNLTFLNPEKATVQNKQHSSSPNEQSKFARSSSQATHPETRATSWSEEEEDEIKGGHFPPGSTVHQTTTKTTTTATYTEEFIVEHLEEDVEEEISINEGCVESPEPNPRKRRVTISFSSPMAGRSRNQSPEHSVVANIYDQYYGDGDEAGQALDDSHIVSPREKQAANLRSSHRSSSSRRRKSSVAFAHRQMSSGKGRPTSSGMARPTSSGRPVSRIDETDAEDSQCVHQGSADEHEAQHREAARNISIVVTTPMPDRRSKPITPGMNRFVSQELTRIPQPSETDEEEQEQEQDGDHLGVDGHRDANGLYQLSPMSEFNMSHQVDHEESFAFEVSYAAPPRNLMRPRSLSSGEGELHKRTLSVNVRHLVSRIQDVEPHELYWSRLTQLTLDKKGLSSLHMLNKFCGRLEILDASDNAVTQLDGAPDTVRTLYVKGNQLGDLTSWEHLRNLQYVDVSGNGLTNLDGLKKLVHLRSLKADNNRLTSISGVFDLDGLLSLRARGNLLETLDFTGCRLKRLSDLDLKGSRLTHVEGLEELTSLSSLNLEENIFEQFVTMEAVTSLKYLKLSGNQLSSIDVQHFPQLRLLYLDRNHLGSVTGLWKTKHLDSLSLREQVPSTLDMAFLNQAFEVRKLFLSGNLLTSFNPVVDFLNLQYLEIANCGLASLPADIGVLMRNLRVVNANFNAIKDLKPLIGMGRLKRLSVAGNRLQRLRRTASVLSYFPTLSQVDLRDNPLTVGFYSTITPTNLVIHSNPEKQAKREEGEEPEPFMLRDLDASQDGKYHARLDMETKLRRRAYEMLLLNGNRRLKKLDGLEVDREVLVKQDSVWSEMLKLGLVKDVSNELPASPIKSQHPPAEVEAPQIKITAASRPSTAQQSTIPPENPPAQLSQSGTPGKTHNETADDAEDTDVATDNASTIMPASVSSSFYREPEMEEVQDVEVGRSVSPKPEEVAEWREIMGESEDDAVEGMNEGETSRWGAEDSFA